MPARPRRWRAAVAIVLVLMSTSMTSRATAAPPPTETTGTITGTVSMEDVELGEAVEIWLVSTTREYLRWQTVDSGDSYAFADVAPGQYYVHFGDGTASDPYRAGGNLAELYPDSHGWADARTVTVVAGATTADVDGHLERRPRPDPATVEISGVVTDSAGQPVEQLSVTASGRDPDAIVGRGSEVLTDSEGRYAFSDLDLTPDTPDQYVLQFGDPRLGPRELHVDDFSPLPQWSGGGESYADRAPVTVPPTGGVTVDVTVRRGGTVRAAVTAATHGFDAGAVMTVVDPAGAEIAATVARSFDTTFRITKVPPGQYYLRFTDPAYPTQWWPGVFSRADALPITVRAAEVTPDLSIAIQPRVVVRTLGAPRIQGTPAVGTTLTVDLGTWSPGPTSDLQLGVEWLADDDVVATGEQMLVGPGLAGRVIRARVTAVHRPSRATTSSTSDPVLVPRHQVALRATASVRYATRKRWHTPNRAWVDVVARASVPALGTRATGPLTVSERGVPVPASHRVVGDRIALRINGPRPGRHVYTLSYPGTPSTLPATTTVTVRVQKPRRPHRADRAVG